jgi:hypothetical protein
VLELFAVAGLDPRQLEVPGRQKFHKPILMKLEGFLRIAWFTCRAPAVGGQEGFGWVEMNGMKLTRRCS